MECSGSPRPYANIGIYDMTLIIKEQSLGLFNSICTHYIINIYNKLFYHNGLSAVLEICAGFCYLTDDRINCLGKWGASWGTCASRGDI